MRRRGSSWLAKLVILGLLLPMAVLPNERVMAKTEQETAEFAMARQEEKEEDPEETPTPTPTSTPTPTEEPDPEETPTPTPTEAVEETPTPTSEPTPTEVAEPTETPAPTTPTPTEEPEPSGTPAPTEGPLPTDTPEPTGEPTTPTPTPTEGGEPTVTPEPSESPEPTPPGGEEGVRGFIFRLYNVMLDRDPEDGGLDFWTKKLEDRTMTAAEVSYEFAMSQEFSDRGLSDRDKLEVMYHTFMNRDGDEEGVKFWMGKFKEGLTMEELYAGFVNAEEFF